LTRKQHDIISYSVSKNICLVSAPVGNGKGNILIISVFFLYRRICK